MARRTISRREPVITLGPLRYRGRIYKEGDHLDRRRVRMPRSKLARLIQGGVCILAKDLDKDKLEKYGYTYDSTLRYHLTTCKPKAKQAGTKVITELKKLTKTITAVKVDGEQIGFIEKIDESKLVNVKVGGDVISETPMKINDAIKMLVERYIKKGE
jgi:hypothetical protein